MEGREEFVILLVEYSSLLMAFISSICCIARADFNFIFALVTYFLWTNLKYKEEGRDELAKKLIVLNLGLLVLDLVCIVSLSSAWGDETDIYASVHNFVLLFSWINFFIRFEIIASMLYVFRDVIRPLASNGHLGYDMRGLPSN